MHERVREGAPDQSSELLSTLKPIALEAAAVVFAQEIQQALEQMLHEGRLAPTKTPRPDEGKKPSDDKKAKD